MAALRSGRLAVVWIGQYGVWWEVGAKVAGTSSPGRKILMTPPPMPDDEPITRRVQSAVQQEETQREMRQFRRAADKWDYWMKWAMGAALGILMTVSGTLTTWINNVSTIQNKHELIISINSTDISAIKTDIRELQASKNNSAGFEKIISGQLDVMGSRISDQDKRQQMQGEGLIAGNRSIHEALEKLMLLTGELSMIDKRITEIERNRARSK